MSVEAVLQPELVWPPVNGSCAPVDPSETQVIAVGVPVAQRPDWDGPTRPLYLGEFTPAALVTDNTATPTIASLLHEIVADRQAGVEEKGMMVLGLENNRSGDNDGYEPAAQLGLLTRTGAVVLRPELDVQTALDPQEAARGGGRMATAFAASRRARQGQAYAPAAPTEAPRQAEPVIIPGRTQAEQPAQQTRVVEAEVARHRRPGKLRAGLLGAQLLVNRMIQRTIGGRGRHSAPGRNNY